MDFQLCPTEQAPAATLACGSGFEMVFWAEVEGDTVAVSPSGLALNQSALMPCPEIEWRPTLQRQSWLAAPIPKLGTPQWMGSLLMSSGLMVSKHQSIGW